MATAIKSTVGNAQVFHNSRNFAACTYGVNTEAKGQWLSIGDVRDYPAWGYLLEKTTGVGYTAYTVLSQAKRKHESGALGDWVVQRRGLHKGAVSIAHKLACIIWSVLTRQTVFNPPESKNPLSSRCLMM